MIEQQLLFGILLSLASVVFHMAGLALLGRFLPAVMPADCGGFISPRRTLFLSTTVIVLIAIHLIEACAWALAFLWLGEFEGFVDALYFSVITATTLGYGDITLSATWRLLSVFEAMTGLLLFGASTACLFQLMTKTLPDPFATPVFGDDDGH